MNKSAIVKWAVVLTGLSFFSLALNISWVYKGLERNHRVGLACVLGQILYVTVILLLVRSSEDILFVPMAQFLGEISTTLLLVIPFFCSRKIKVQDRISLHDFREGLNILQCSGSLIFSQLLRLFIFTFDVILLEFLLGEKEVGLYSASYRFCFLLLAVAAAIRVSYIPALIRASAEGREQIRDITRRSIELSSAISAPMVVGGIILAAPLLSMLFGPEYVEGTPAFQLLILSLGFIFISDANQNILLVCDRMKVYMGIVAIAATVNVGLNLVLIPRYGIIGAAFATVTAEALLLFTGLLVIYKFGVRLSLRPIIRPLLAAGMMGLGLISFGTNRDLFLHLGLGFIIYVGSLTLFRGIPQDARLYLENLWYGSKT